MTGAVLACSPSLRVPAPRSSLALTRMDSDSLEQELLQRIETLAREKAELALQLRTALDRRAPEPCETVLQQLLSRNGQIRLLVRPPDGAILDGNPAALAFYGYSREAFKRLRMPDLDQDTTVWNADIDLRHRARHQVASGEMRYVEVHATPLTVDGEPVLLLAVTDVTARREQELALRRSERMFRRLVESSTDLVYQVNGRGYFEYANPAALRQAGYTREELPTLHFTELVRPDYRTRMYAFYARLPAERLADAYLEFPVVCRDGREVWLGQNVQVIWNGTRLAGYQGVARDITDRRTVERLLMDEITRLNRRTQRLQQRLGHLTRANLELGGQAVTDPLTGLYNRRALEAHIRQAFDSARQTGMPLSMLVIDLDDFKRVNDTRGHAAGDQLLEKVGDLLRENVRSTDRVARYGGEEFAVLLALTDQDGAVAQAERFRTLMESSLREAGITASFGVASLTPSVSSPQELIVQADTALYAAKMQRNCVRHYARIDPDIRGRIFHSA